MFRVDTYWESGVTRRLHKTWLGAVVHAQIDHDSGAAIVDIINTEIKGMKGVIKTYLATE